MKTNNRMTSEILAMRRSLSSLDRSIRRLAPMLKAMATSNGSSGANGVGRRRRPRLSAKQRAALKIQGRYMGFMRQLAPKQKAEVRRIREKSGVLVAVKLAERLAHA